MSGLPKLLDLLELEELDRDLYRARTPAETERVTLYGGLVAAQALRAAALTVPAGRFPHSTHGYFLRAGQIDRNIIMRVSRDRDGRSYSARKVDAIQDGEVIFSLSCSFQVPEPHGPEMDSPPPAGVWDIEALPYAAHGQGSPDLHEAFHVKVFPMHQHPDGPPELERPIARAWVKPRGTVGDDPIINACVLMYLSDEGTGFNELDLPRVPFGGGPTLDHSVWIHRPVRIDQWLLLHLEPVVATRGRGLYHGSFFTADGARVASLTQEIVVRDTPAEVVDRIAEMWTRWYDRTGHRLAPDE